MKQETVKTAKEVAVAKEVKSNSLLYGIKINMPWKVWQSMKGWCDAATSEVSGMFVVKKEGSTFQIGDVFLPYQIGSAGGTEIKTEGMAWIFKWLYDRKMDIRDLRGWWHTHYDFSVFWSSIDDANVERLLKASKSWALSFVLNQSGDYKCRLDLFDAWPVGRITFDDLSVNMIGEKTTEDINYHTDILGSVEKWKPQPIHKSVFPSDQLSKKLSKSQKRRRRRIRKQLRDNSMANDDVEKVATWLAKQGASDVQVKNLLQLETKVAHDNAKIWCLEQLEWVDPKKMGWRDEYWHWHPPTESSVIEIGGSA